MEGISAAAVAACTFSPIWIEGRAQEDKFTILFLLRFFFFLLAALLLFSLRFTRSQNVIRPAKDSEKLHDICWFGDDIIYGVIIGEPAAQASSSNVGWLDPLSWC